MIEEGGVYTAFGSEFRLLLLNGIDESLKYRLFLYGIPAVVVVELPIDPHLSRFTDSICKFLFSLWIHRRLGLDDIDKPTGFACYIKADIPPDYIRQILHPEKVYDQYNSDHRWYSWNEMFAQK